MKADELMVGDIVYSYHELSRIITNYERFILIS